MAKSTANKSPQEVEVLLNLDSVALERFLVLEKAVRECPATARELETQRAAAATGLSAVKLSYLRKRIVKYNRWHLDRGAPPHHRRNALEEIALSISHELGLKTTIHKLQDMRSKASAHIKTQKKLIDQFAAHKREIQSSE